MPARVCVCVCAHVIYTIPTLVRVCVCLQTSHARHLRGEKEQLVARLRHQARVCANLREMLEGKLRAVQQHREALLHSQLAYQNEVCECVNVHTYMCSYANYHIHTHTYTHTHLHALAGRRWSCRTQSPCGRSERESAPTLSKTDGHTGHDALPHYTAGLVLARPYLSSLHLSFRGSGAVLAMWAQLLLRVRAIYEDRGKSALRGEQECDKEGACVS
jgi:hypothetical protein